jgi:hypothetical protein
MRGMFYGVLRGLAYETKTISDWMLFNATYSARYTAAALRR